VKIGLHLTNSWGQPGWANSRAQCASIQIAVVNAVINRPDGGDQERLHQKQTPPSFYFFSMVPEVNLIGAMV
jgi:hypothetical protein